jgi:WD40 repeat protein
LSTIEHKYVFYATTDNTIVVWNLDNSMLEQQLYGHTASVNGVAVVDANRIVSASDDRTLKVWNLQTGQIIASVGLDGALTCVAVTRQNGRTLVVAGDAGGALYCLELVEPVGQ